MKRMASSMGISESTATILVLCVMMSRVCFSSNSMMLEIISASSASSTPCSWDSLTMEMISSSVTISAASESIPTIFRRIWHPPSRHLLIGARSTVTAFISPKSLKKYFSARRLPSRSGIMWENRTTRYMNTIVAATTYTVGRTASL